MKEARNKQMKETGEDQPERPEPTDAPKKPGVVVEQNRAWRIKMGIQEG